MRRISILLCALFLHVATQAAELQHRNVEVYGQRIHYAEAGNGPTLLLLHGLWGGLNEWQPIIGPLSESHRVIVMDFLGFHGSDKPGVQYHNALLAQFLAGFIETLELRDVTLVGHAMGANAATYTAVHHPENIAALVLIDGAGYRNPARDPAAPLSAGQIRFRQIATGSSKHSTRGLLERRVKDANLITDRWVEEAFALWVNSARAIGDMLFAGGELTEDEMRSIKLPTLVVWGAEDKVFPLENSDRLAADIETARVVVIENSGHLPQLERTREFLAAVMPFLHNL